MARTVRMRLIAMPARLVNIAGTETLRGPLGWPGADWFARRLECPAAFNRRWTDEQQRPGAPPTRRAPTTGPPHALDDRAPTGTTPWGQHRCQRERVR